MRGLSWQSARGFTLIEMLVTMAILLVVIAPLLEGAARYMQRHRGQQLIVAMNQSLRATQELMSQEIGQAGFHNFVPRQLTADVAGAPAVQAVPVSGTASFFVGQKLSVNVGGNQEIVRITAVGPGTVSGIFRKNHPAAAVITEVGPFATGVLPASTANVLQMYGDINGDGTLMFVEYRHTPATRQLTRAITPINAVAQNAADVTLDNVLPNAGGVPVFQYRTATRAGFTFVTEVVVTLTVQALDRDPVTGAFRTQAASFTLTPRNVLAAFDLAGLLGTEKVQNEPPGLPIP